MAVAFPRKRFTVDEYYRMAESGILREDDHVELIDGEIVEMSPIGLRHAACVNRLNALLYGLLGDRIILGVQNPLRLSHYSEPQPDITVLKFRDDYYAERHPTPEDTHLLIEVADTTLAYDRGVKLPMYAANGVPEVWIVNLDDAVVEVYRHPGPNGYGETQLARRGDSLPLSSVGETLIKVDDVLG
jgi:Uma2 family endonuclease